MLSPQAFGFCLVARAETAFMDGSRRLVWRHEDRLCAQMSAHSHAALSWLSAFARANGDFPSFSILHTFSCCVPFKTENGSATALWGNMRTGQSVLNMSIKIKPPHNWHIYKWTDSKRPHNSFRHFFFPSFGWEGHHEYREKPGSLSTWNFNSAIKAVINNRLQIQAERQAALKCILIKKNRMAKKSVG